MRYDARWKDAIALLSNKGNIDLFRTAKDENSIDSLEKDNKEANDRILRYRRTLQHGGKCWRGLGFPRTYIQQGSRGVFEHANTSWLTTNLRMRSCFIWWRITRDSISFRRFIMPWVLALSELIVFPMQGLWLYKGSRLVTNSIKANLWLQGKPTGFVGRKKLHFILLATLGDKFDAADDITS